MCPARTVDDRDVLIRLVAKGKDGLNHLEALRRVASGNAGSRGDNHTVPVFRFLSLEDMTFAVFPLMAIGFDIPWYHRLDETIHAAIQLLEVGVSFLLWRKRLPIHLHRVSHSYMLVWSHI